MWIWCMYKDDITENLSFYALCSIFLMFTNWQYAKMTTSWLLILIMMMDFKSSLTFIEIMGLIFNVHFSKK